MVRLMSYLLTIVIVLSFLIVVVPFALLAADPTVKAMLAAKEATDTITSVTNWQNVLDLQFFKTGGSIASIVVFMIVGYALLFVQQYFWVVFIKKNSQYEVPKKWIVRYRYVGILAAWTILMAFVFALVAWALPIGSSTKMGEWISYYWVRANIYIAFIVITGVFGLVTIGLAAYINLQIAYDQQIKLVNEGIANGTYDPVTRLPIEQSVDSNIKIHDVDDYKEKHSDVDDNFLKDNPDDNDEYNGFDNEPTRQHDHKEQDHHDLGEQASAGFLSSKKESTHDQKDDAKH